VLCQKQLVINLYFPILYVYDIFYSVITVTFQINFYIKIYVNNIFLFFKNYFWHQHIKTIQNIQIILNFNKKILNFLETWFTPYSQKILSKSVEISSLGEKNIASNSLTLYDFSACLNLKEWLLMPWPLQFVYQFCN
jgi:hypothetical protein